LKLLIYWRFIDLVCIDFAKLSRYILFDRVCSFLDTLSLSMEFVVPFDLDKNGLTKNSLVFENPCICVHLFKAVPLTSGISLKPRQEFSIPLFLQINFESTNSSISENPEKEILIQIRILPEFKYLIVSSFDDRFAYDAENNSFAIKYVTFNDLQENFLTDAYSAVGTLQLAVELYNLPTNNIMWQITGSNAMSIQIGEYCQMHLQFVGSSPLVAPECILSFSVSLSQYLIDSLVAHTQILLSQNQLITGATIDV
jgi:hypothetical protein